MGGLFSTSSNTDRRTYTTTTTYDGSFNNAYSSANTQENVGNTSFSLGLPGGGSAGGTDYVLIALAALLGLAGVALLFRAN